MIQLVEFKSDQQNIQISSKVNQQRVEEARMGVRSSVKPGGFSWLEARQRLLRVGCFILYTD